MEFLQTDIAGNSLQAWLIAVAISVIVMMLMGSVRYVGARQFKRLGEQHDVAVFPILREALRKTKWLFILIIAIFFASLALTVPDKIQQVLLRVVVIALLIQSGVWAVAILRVAMTRYRQDQMEKDPASITTLNLLNFIGRLFIWVLVLLLVLDNLGVNITALVAGLGVGGIAVALALQTILGDLFASLSIVLDKPFVVGDFLNIDSMLGTVENVGLKTTRLRSLSGEQLVFSNSDLLNSRIRNYGRMYQRRVVFELGVTYQTPRDKLILIPQIIRTAIEAQSETRFDRSHFKAYGDFALTFESVYYVLGPDYNLYMDIQQAINLIIHERFEQEGIEFAYPTQTLFVQKNTV